MESVVANPKDSTLDAFFVLNEGTGYSPEDVQLARSTLYHNIPQHFTWKAKTQRWEPRVKAMPTLPVILSKVVIGRGPTPVKILFRLRLQKICPRRSPTTTLRVLTMV